MKDLNGLTEAQLLEKLNAHFVVEDMGTEIYHPAKLHEFSMYLGGKWYRLTAKPGSYDDNDPIGVLDVTILSKHVCWRTFWTSRICVPPSALISLAESEDWVS